MKIVSVSSTLMMVSLLATSPVLAQTSPAGTPQTQAPAMQNPGGATGMSANNTSTVAAKKQQTQSLTPPGNEDAWEKGKQK